jgi:hypothetical protein
MALFRARRRAVSSSRAAGDSGLDQKRETIPEVAIEMAQRLALLADQNDASTTDDRCVMLNGVIRDCAYKIRKCAEEVRRANTGRA